MTDGEKLDLLLSEMKDMKSEMQGMKSEIKDMKSEMKDMKSEIKDIKTDMQCMNNRIDNLESQIQQTERILKNEIRKESALVLDEVERVHNLLDKHKADTTKHTA